MWDRHAGLHCVSYHAWPVPPAAARSVPVVHLIPAGSMHPLADGWSWVEEHTLPPGGLGPLPLRGAMLFTPSVSTRPPPTGRLASGLWTAATPE
jgi:hypothetical protein